MRVIVNIRGANGSGKSTIARSMMDDPDMFVDGFNYKNEKLVSPKITVFPKYKWIAIGTYFNKTGGMDGIANFALKRQAIEFAWNKYPDYDILLEGAIDSTVFGSYGTMFAEYKARIAAGEVSHRTIIILNFLPSLEECLRRIYERNGNTPILEWKVEHKLKCVLSSMRRFKEAGFITLKYDTSKCKLEEMLGKFNKIIDKYRGV